MKIWILVILGNFEILNPSWDQNFRSLTLTPNLDFDKNFVIFVEKIMNFHEKFCEIDKICYIFWKPNFEILNPKIGILKSLTLKSQNCQNWIKNHPKSKFLTVEYLRIRFCIDIIFQIFSKFIRSWLDINYPNLKFWSPYIIKISPKFTKIGSNHQNFVENSSNLHESLDVRSALENDDLLHRPNTREHLIQHLAKNLEDSIFEFCETKNDGK